MLEERDSYPVAYVVFTWSYLGCDWGELAGVGQDTHDPGLNRTACEKIDPAPVGMARAVAIVCFPPRTKCFF